MDVGLKKCQVKSLTLPEHRVWGLPVQEQGTLVLRFQVQAVLVVSADCLLHALISAGAQKSNVFCNGYSKLIFIRLKQIICQQLPVLIVLWLMSCAELFLPVLKKVLTCSCRAQQKSSAAKSSPYVV